MHDVAGPPAAEQVSTPAAEPETLAGASEPGGSLEGPAGKALPPRGGHRTPGSSASGTSGASSLARVALVVLALVAGFALVPRALRSCGVITDEDAPDFRANLVANPPTPEQKVLSLSELRGRPVLLDFWATWCPPCQAEAPIVNAIGQRFRDRGLVVVGVDTSDERGLAEVWARRKGITFPIVFDDGNAVAQRFHVDNLPTLVVVSKTGKIVAVRHGITSDADLERLVREVL